MILSFNILTNTYCNNAINGNLREDHFIKMDKISCCSLEYIGPQTKRSCSVQCAALDQFCNGFTIANSKCLLCKACVGFLKPLEEFITGYGRKSIVGKDDLEGT